MARPRTHSFWVREINVYARNQPDLKAPAIRRLLESPNITPPPAAGSIPDERTVRRLLTEFRNVPESEKVEFELFRWPESIEAGLLPWESSKVMLEALRYRLENGLSPLLVSDARLYWRVCQAIPDAPVEYRVLFGTYLVDAVADQSPEELRIIQWQLAFQPWRSPEDERAYKRLPRELRWPELEGACPNEEAVADPIEPWPNPAEIFNDDEYYTEIHAAHLGRELDRMKIYIAQEDKRRKG